jgi:hypothetical protein
MFFWHGFWFSPHKVFVSSQYFTTNGYNSVVVIERVCPPADCIILSKLEEGRKKCNNFVLVYNFVMMVEL